MPADPDAVELILTDETPVAPSVGGSPRLRLVDRIGQRLADPPPGRANEPLPEEIDASVSDVPGLSDVLWDAPEVVSAWPANAVRVVRGRGGVVVRVNAHAWSLVFRLGGRVVVVLNDAPHTAWRIDRDRAWSSEVRSMIDAVMREVDRHALDAG
jgi:hypothetical protein